MADLSALTAITEGKNVQEEHVRLALEVATILAWENANGDYATFFDILIELLKVLLPIIIELLGKKE